MGKIKVDFLAGESRSQTCYGSDGHVHMASCNYMIATCEDKDGWEVELYAEISPESYDEFADNEDIDWGRFDDITFPLLKAEIIEQAAECGISEQELDFGELPQDIEDLTQSLPDSKKDEELISNEDKIINYLKRYTRSAGFCVISKHSKMYFIAVPDDCRFDPIENDLIYASIYMGDELIVYRGDASIHSFTLHGDKVVYLPEMLHGHTDYTDAILRFDEIDGEIFPKGLQPIYPGDVHMFSA